MQDIGCCGLHVVSGALHIRVVACSWPIEKVPQAVFKFLYNSPARRVEYFCVIKWLISIKILCNPVGGELKGC